MNETNYPRDTVHNGSQHRTGFLYIILPIIFVLILIGNALLLAINSFRFRRVPDLLVGSLAAIDLLNDFGPVLISTIVFQVNPDGFRGLQMEALCHFYNWISSFIACLLRLSLH